MDTNTYGHKKKILFFGVLPESVINFRFDLITFLISKGYKVDILVSNPTQLFIIELNKYNIDVYSTNLERRSFNPFNLFISFLKTLRLIKKANYDLVISYTVKPLIISLLCKTFSGKFKLILLIEGLGSIFDVGDKVKHVVRFFLLSFYRLFFNKAEASVFLNEENRNYFIKQSICSYKNSFLLNGIGVNLKKYSYSEFNFEGKVVFLLISRLIKEKGIIEFIESAKSIKLRFFNTEFRLVGSLEDNSYILKKIHEYEAHGYIKYLGYLNDVIPEIVASSVFVLPTYYNEGLPRTILESMAIGRPIVTTNTPGCNKTVIEGVNGFFVNPRDQSHLTNVLKRFVEDPSLIQKMGRRSRVLAENEFSIDRINNIFFKNIINPILK